MIDENIIKEIQEKYTVNVDQVLYNPKKEEQVVELQKICNKLYEEHGASPEIIRFQAMINSIRHEQNITDPSEVIHFDEGEAFVQ